MNVNEAIHERRSVRRFKPEAIKESDINELLEAAIKAPTAGNVQPWKFSVIRKEEVKRSLSVAALNQGWVLEAPVVVVVMADLDRAARSYGRRGVELYCIQDTAAAIQNILLAGVQKGIYGCWIGAFLEEQVSSILNLPSSIRPLALLPLGYPERVPAAPPRLGVQEVLW